LSEDFKLEVENRLNDMFQEDEEPKEDLEGLGDHPLKGLKAMILSVEWEISDNSMEGLINEIKTLEEFYQNDKVILNFLRLLHPIARYVKARKGESHPRAAGLLNSVYNSLERVALSKDMNRKEKEAILLREVEKFKKLKEDVIRRREEKKEAPGVQEPLTEPGGSASPGQFAAAVEEIKELIREEFRALREELRRWRDSR